MAITPYFACLVCKVVEVAPSLSSNAQHYQVSRQELDDA